ncbi:MAG: transporter, substrate-binding protein, partial [Parcubacteria group bacterium]|nr:transporter, substrate-binding protein [Parcubacteria group bacterium]
MKREYIIGLVFLVLFGGAFAWIATHPKSPQAASGKLQVATSFYPLYFFTTQLGGDKVDVTNITPSGAEPHDFEPTTQDIAKIEGGNLL